MGLARGAPPRTVTRQQSLKGATSVSYLKQNQEEASVIELIFIVVVSICRALPFKASHTMQTLHSLNI